MDHFEQIFTEAQKEKTDADAVAEAQRMSTGAARQEYLDQWAHGLKLNVDIALEGSDFFGPPAEYELAEDARKMVTFTYERCGKVLSVRVRSAILVKSAPILVPQGIVLSPGVTPPDDISKSLQSVQRNGPVSYGCYLEVSLFRTGNEKISAIVNFVPYSLGLNQLPIAETPGLRTVVENLVRRAALQS